MAKIFNFMSLNAKGPLHHKSFLFVSIFYWTWKQDRENPGQWFLFLVFCFTFTKWMWNKWINTSLFPLRLFYFLKFHIVSCSVNVFFRETIALFLIVTKRQVVVRRIRIFTFTWSIQNRIPWNRKHWRGLFLHMKHTWIDIFSQDV